MILDACAAIAKIVDWSAKRPEQPDKDITQATDEQWARKSSCRKEEGRRQ